MSEETRKYICFENGEEYLKISLNSIYMSKVWACPLRGWQKCILINRE
jgi:hypothetical protein